MIFRSRSSPREIFFTNRPTGIGIEYVEKIDDNGVRYLAESGKKDLNAFVQASLAGTLIYNIMNRYALGDVGVLEKVRSFCGDVSRVPLSLADAVNMMDDVSKRFTDLPVEVKQLFNNSAVEFSSSCLNGEAEKRLNAFVKRKVESSKAKKSKESDGENNG